ncbi:hypothetical protein ABTY20_22815 [Streptomyces sp. NPDC126497]|uniref:hypothetical protein n=1 Tax=Streptomyces sp. NPDC126497 TaxID=3155313 RepID=UPI00331736DC
MALTDRRRRWWRWAVVAWLILGTAAGGLTLWLQDSTEPRRYGWEEAGPTPSPPRGRESACAGTTPDQDGGTLCFVRSR